MDEQVLRFQMLLVRHHADAVSTDATFYYFVNVSDNNSVRYVPHPQYSDYVRGKFSRPQQVAVPVSMNGCTGTVGR